MNVATREVPNHPGIHRPYCCCARFNGTGNRWDFVQQPPELGACEECREWQAADVSQCILTSELVLEACHLAHHVDTCMQQVSHTSSLRVVGSGSTAMRRASLLPTALCAPAACCLLPRDCCFNTALQHCTATLLTVARVRVSSHNMLSYNGTPVLLSQTMMLSRWLVTPTAWTSDARPVVPVSRHGIESRVLSLCPGQ